MTTDLATARAAVSARRRRKFHGDRVAAAEPGRDKLWAAANWAVSEAVQLPAQEREQVVAALLTIAKQLNGRHTHDT